MAVEWFPIKSSISEYIRQAELVIGHAGAGTILETLRSRTKLLVVTNPSLMDDHQTEIADAMVAGSYLEKANFDNLFEVLPLVDRRRFKPYPLADARPFVSLVETELGLV